MPAGQGGAKNGRPEAAVSSGFHHRRRTSGRNRLMTGPSSGAPSGSSTACACLCKRCMVTGGVAFPAAKKEVTKTGAATQTRLISFDDVGAEPYGRNPGTGQALSRCKASFGTKLMLALMSSYEDRWPLGVLGGDWTRRALPL